MSNDKSPRGRKATPAADVIDVEVNQAAIAADGQALVVFGQRSKEVAERFGDGSPYERKRVVDQARWFMGNAAEAMLEVGKCLVKIKENEPHGDFVHIVEDQLGIGQRSARMMMQAAVKFLLSPALAGKRQTFADFGKAKLFDLAAESTDDLVELAEGGTLAGFQLDELRSMSVRELRQALADARKDKSAKDKVIEAKSKKIDDLEEQLHRRASSEPAERETAQLELLRADCLAAELALLRALATIDQVMQEPATGAAELAARHSVDFIVRKFVDACQTRAIGINLADPCSPIWYQPIEEMVAQYRAGEKA